MYPVLYVEVSMTERYEGRDRRRSRTRSYERRRRRSRSRSRNRSPRATRRASPERSAPLNKRQCWYAVKYDPIQIGSIDGTDTTPHDKGLVRAMEARYDVSKDPKIQGDPYATLFVGRLAYTTSEATLERFFSSYGRIKRLRLVRDVVTQQSKGYAFVEFESERSCLRAYQDAHRQELDGRVLLVDYERSRVMTGWKPRRLGGGLGGKKESGQLRFGGREHPFKPPR